MKTIHYVDHSSKHLITVRVADEKKFPTYVVVDTIFDRVRNIRGHDAVIHWTRIAEYLNAAGGSGGSVTAVLWGKSNCEYGWDGKTFASRFYHKKEGSGHIAIGAYSRERDIEWRKLEDGYQVVGDYLVEDGVVPVKIR